MIHYTKIETKDNGFLVFKVIGAQSKKKADQIVKKNMGELLFNGGHKQGKVTICPLFCNSEISKIRYR